MKFRKMLARILILLIGLTIAHFGVTLFILSNLGSDPFNVFIQGLSGTTGFTHGICHMAVCFLIILVLLIVAREYVKIGTIICMLLGGPIIDAFKWLLQNVITDQLPFAVRLFLLVVGCVILAFGMTIVIKSEAGTGPNDLVSLVISEKGHLPFGPCRVIADLLFVIIGYFLGGVVGIGTVICAFLVGPVAGKIMPLSENIVQALLGQKGKQKDDAES